VKIQGDMQTPSTPAGAPLELAGPEGDEAQGSPGPGESLQKILKFELKEEGNHVLAVTVTYTETVLAGDGKAASGGRVRTFRKLYQFVAQQLLSVRTKAGEVGEKNGLVRCLLEAQLENMGESTVALEVCSFYTVVETTFELPYRLAPSHNPDYMGSVCSKSAIVLTSTDRSRHSKTAFPSDIFELGYGVTRRRATQACANTKPTRCHSSGILIRTTGRV
jgi:hypothetical protein